MDFPTFRSARTLFYSRLPCQSYRLYSRMCGLSRYRLLITVIAFVHSLALTRAQPAECLEPYRQIIEEYKAFHNANKLSPDAQYLVHICWGGSCAGTGDRIRGALWLLRVAITYKKILLVDWTKPAPLTDFLVPNEIDWTFSGLDEMLFRNGSSTLSTDDFNDAVYRQVPTALEKFLSTKVYTTNSNQHFDTRDMVGVQPVDRLYEDGSCFFKFLFKPHPLIAARGDAHLQQLYGSESVDYVAWHWRHFDADGMSEKGIMASELSRVLSCAEGMARKVDVDLDQRPMLLVTDFNVFRQMVANRELRRLITPNIVARHIDLGQHAHDELVDIFVDLYLLSRARCLLTSRSGFSNMAVWMGGARLLTCHQDMTCF